MSADYQTAITPAGYAFSIWGAIYFALALQMVLICLPGQGEWAAENLYLWLTINFVANGLWIFIWTGEQIVLAAVWIAVLVVLPLIPVYLKAGFASEWSPLVAAVFRLEQPPSGT